MEDAEILVQGYIDTIVDKPDARDEEVISALTTAGAVKPDVVAAMHFTQIAFGRFILEGTDIELNDEYVRMRPDGDIYERGELTTNPMYSAARRLASTTAGRKAFQAIVLRSAELDAVNKSMHRDSVPGMQGLTPVIIIDSQPTAQGIKMVRAFLESEVCESGPVN